MTATNNAGGEPLQLQNLAFSYDSGNQVVGIELTILNIVTISVPSH